ncbi:MAG: type II secretion system protein GspG [Planctomycetia bacterium]|nr:type II secretion system protein GspG [Planctomycetia bacterium]
MKRAMGAMLVVVMAGCGKEPPPATPGGWGAAPSGPFWEALGRIPAVSPAKAGYLVPSAARSEHVPWTESGHEKWLKKAETVFVQRLKLPANDMRELVWGEVTPADAPVWGFMSVRFETAEASIVKAIGEQGFGRGEDDVWSRAGERSRFLVGGGWVTFVNGGDEEAAALRDARAGRRPSMQTLAPVPALAAALGGLLPASITVGIDRPPAPDVAARVVATAEAPDAAAREEVRAMAFDGDGGPAALLGSESWKKMVEAWKSAPKTESRGAYLRMRTPQPGPAEMAEKARETRTRAEIKSLEACAQLFRIDTNRFPATMDDFQGYYGGDGKDGWGRPIRYKMPGPGDRAFELRSAGPDGKEGTEDDITN